KNHHVHGSFGDHVRALTLVRTDGETLKCSASRHPEYLAATIGGLGLTGLITKAVIQLRPVKGPWLEAEHIPFDDLGAFFELSDSSEVDWEHTVSWIDCLSSQGRGIFMRANHSRRPDWRKSNGAKLAVPVVPPLSLVNRLTLRPFNTVYYHLQARKAGPQTVHYLPFFHPLDGIRNWNRIYGPKGFHQYQCVVPRENGQEVIHAILGEISRSGQGSFLAVLKTFGNRQAPGMLSFCRPGVTLALDFPYLGEANERLFRRLDALVM